MNEKDALLAQSSREIDMLSSLKGLPFCIQMVDHDPVTNLIVLERGECSLMDLISEHHGNTAFIDYMWPQVNK